LGKKTIVLSAQGRKGQKSQGGRTREEKTQKRKEALRNQVGLRLCRHWPKQDTDFVEEEKMKGCCEDWPLSSDP
jgi:hypothetical protein